MDGPQVSGKRVVGIEARKTEDDDHDGLPLRLRDGIEVIEDADATFPVRSPFVRQLACSSFIAVSGTIEQHSFSSSVPPSLMRVLSLSNEICAGEGIRGTRGM